MWKRYFLVLLSLLILLDGFQRALSVAAGPAPLRADAIGYWQEGREVAAGDWLLRQHPSAFRPPLYAVYLGFCQYCFGDWALLAAILGQHLMGVATSLLVGWTCGRLTGSGGAFLAAYAVSMQCLGRVQYANFILSETLFTLTVTLHLAALVAWHLDANRRTAVRLGVSLGLCLLVRPVAQWLWVPELMLLLGRRGVHGEWAFRSRLSESAWFLAAFVVLVAPWLLRNEWVYGQPFLTQSQGRHLWVSCFSARAANLPLPDEETARQLKSVDYRDEWEVYGSLHNSGLSEVDSDAWMRAVCLKAIRENPGRFAASVVRNCFIFWWANNEAFPWSIRYAPDQEASYFGQRTWCLERWLTPFNGVLRFAYRYPAVGLAAAAAAAFLGAILLLADRSQRRAGVALLVLLLYFAFVTALVQEPRFRYRMVIDPVMIVATVAGFWIAASSLWNRAGGAEPVLDPQH